MINDMARKLPAYLSENENGLWLTEDERENLKIDYRIKEIIFEEDSPFQHVMILDSYCFGRMLALDGIVQTTAMDGHIYNETISHVPLSIHPDPQKVLIIGGGDCGVAKEVCKYSCVKQINVVEIDKTVVDVCREFLPEVSGRLSDPRVSFIFEDGVEFARKTDMKYDLIIVDSSDPIGPATALFEKSFYQSLFNCLEDDGLMVCQSQSPIFHSDVMEQTFQRISELFPITKMFTSVVPAYPGGLWSFTLGSKKYTNPKPMKVIKMDTQYINEQIIEHSFSLSQFMKKQLGKIK